MSSITCCGPAQVLNAYGKVFPTPPPSRRPIRVRQARMAAEKAAQEEGQPGVDGKGHEADGGQADDHGRHKLGQLLCQLTSADALVADFQSMLVRNG